MTEEKTYGVIRLAKIDAQHPQWDAVDQWVKDNVDEYDLQYGAPCLVALSGDEIVGVMQIKNVPMCAMGFDRNKSIHQTIRTFSAMQSALDGLGFYGALSVVDQHSPLLESAKLVMNEWPSNKKLFIMRKPGG